ncbi:MAG TPA: UV DNA damage repair endonuclease UvsE [Tepidisphaeraceae bacterium]|jgi:UV DNA damage endonuclease
MPKAPARKDAPAATMVPELGLVCVTVGPEVRYKTLTRTRFLAMSPEARKVKLRPLYHSNLMTLYGALAFCRSRGIRLYRVTSDLFPHGEDDEGRAVLEELRPQMNGFGQLAEKMGIRIVLHPDQFVVLNSESEAVVEQSVSVLAHHARVFDALELPRTSWCAFNVHGGKAGRPGELIDRIQKLPEEIRNRLTLENDEYSYGAREILDICRRAKVPMLFDAHHHIVNQKLEDYEDASIARFVREARDTWPRPDWQMVHISNGKEKFSDPCHHDLVKVLPSAFRDVPWIEVEAKAKEVAIHKLRLRMKR